ncbi:acetyl-CoA carboxylase carboxyltransferase subunit beta [Drancourtella massiliensis]|uniref:Multifunctional fusion protein n=1 Tax=Drancourtella massiliensis TaxID=1632013 RepID=A0ABS2EEK5_9FIRM|nr:acetyl-CoA carboxylase carboxyltransferase subunit alpha [Drancourtella massiliensis]MBM6743311.1 acetyl-CoA carboxylase carboxyltransferase subunit beta [Drancourtella massiliensis]
MKLSNMFKKTERKNYITIHTSDKKGKPEVPEGLLKKCNACKAAIVTEDVKNNYYICPKCHNYFRVHARRRVEMIVDEGTFEEWDHGLNAGNPLSFPGYEEKVKALQEKTNLDEAVMTGKAQINGNEVVLGICDGRFMMASMGWAVGEKIARAVERATEEKLPVIIFACSGGARMQEGIVSLMQMAKTSAVLKKHSDAGLLYISVLTNPTTGGVTASFAMLGDVILAEPNALIGFAGPRVIEQTIGQKLPEGFQKSEFLLEHGFIDRIVEREEMKEVLASILSMHKIEENGEDWRQECCQNEGEEKRVPYKGLTSWERVQISRRKDRPVGSDYIHTLFTDFIELHGDRYFKDDKAIIGGIARFHGMPVTVIAQERGTTTKENILRNFGMPSPDGYRKALRLMKQAEKFHRPVICFVDTPGAFCGIEAEERGQGEAIARNIYEMSGLKTPVVSIVIGEGESGGALAIATADEVWMLENSIYSILSPEGFASILWKDSKRAKEAAGVMKLTANHLKSMEIVEQVIPEPDNFTSANLEEVADRLDRSLKKFICEYMEMDADALVEKRYRRFRRM